MTSLPMKSLRVYPGPSKQRTNTSIEDTTNGVDGRSSSALWEATARLTEQNKVE